MDLSPTFAFRALTALLVALSVYFTVDVELRRAALRGDAEGLELGSGDVVQITAAVDGDEVSVTRDGQAFMIRLLGIKALDTVDESDPSDPGARATAALQAWAGRSGSVAFTQYDTDPAGRVLAYLTLVCPPDQPDCAAVDLGGELVARGLVAAYTKYPFDRADAYVAAEQQARAAGVGLWAFPRDAERVDAMRATWSAP